MRQLNGWTGLLTSITVLLAAVGCGGGSGSSGGSGGAALPQGNAAVRSVGIAGFQSLGAGAAYPYNALTLSSPTTSSIHSKAATQLLALLRPGFKLSRASADRNAPLSYVSSLNLYTAGAIFSGNIGTATYFTDAAGTKPAGSLTLTLPTNVTDTTDPTSYSGYPAVVSLSIDITAGNLPCKGNCTITFGGATGANTMVGSCTLTRINVTIDINLVLTDQLAVTGTITVHENGATIDMTGVSGQVLGPLTSKITVAPYGYTGTATINLTTGALSVMLNTSTGTSSVASNTAGGLNFNYSDGSTESILNAYAASLSTTGTTGSGGTGGTGGSPTYNAPVILPLGTITAINGLGQGVGRNVDAGTSYYLSSPTAAQQTIPSPTGAKYFGAASINDSGQIVGSGYISTNQSSNAYYWSSPTSQPSLLAVPANTGTAYASCINKSGQIVGTAQTSASAVSQGVFWASPTSQPVVLHTLSGDIGSNPIYIGPGGQIVGTSVGNTSTTSVYWSSSTAQPQALSVPTGDSYLTLGGVDPAGLVVGSSDFQNGQADSALTWANGGSAVKLPMLTGVTLSPSRGTVANGVNSTGVIVGAEAGYINSNPFDDAVMWQNGKATDLNNLIPSGGKWTLNDATQITDSGWILGTAAPTGGNDVGSMQFVLQPK